MLIISYFNRLLYLASLSIKVTILALNGILFSIPLLGGYFIMLKYYLVSNNMLHNIKVCADVWCIYYILHTHILCITSFYARFLLLIICSLVSIQYSDSYKTNLDIYFPSNNVVGGKYSQMSHRVKLPVVVFFPGNIHVKTSSYIQIYRSLDTLKWLSISAMLSLPLMIVYDILKRRWRMDIRT